SPHMRNTHWATALTADISHVDDDEVKVRSPAGSGHVRSNLKALRPAPPAEQCPRRHVSTEASVTQVSSETDTVAWVQRLPNASPAAWPVAQGLGRGAVPTTLMAGDAALLVVRGARPFRWTVTLAGRTRGVPSIAGLLRPVRRVADPEHQASRLRI